LRGDEKDRIDERKREKRFVNTHDLRLLARAWMIRIFGCENA
jgi:hypothetical protein